MTGYMNNDTFVHGVIESNFCMNSLKTFVTWVMCPSSYGTVRFDESACFSDPNPEMTRICDWTAATLSTVGQRLMFQ